MTAASGFTIGANLGRKKNGLAFIQFTATLTGAAIAVVPTSGDITDTPVATLNSGWGAAPGMVYPLTPENTRNVLSGSSAPASPSRSPRPG